MKATASAGRVPVLLLAALGLFLGAACHRSTTSLPDRSDAAVKHEEERLAPLLGAAGAVLGGPGTCRVRLLGREGTSSFAWADCEGASGERASLPVRVDGDRIIRPTDGAAYETSVRRLFPPAIARLVIDEPGRLRP